MSELMCFKSTGCTKDIHSCFIWTCKWWQIHSAPPFWSHLWILCGIDLFQIFQNKIFWKQFILSLNLPTKHLTFFLIL